MTQISNDNWSETSHQPQSIPGFNLIVDHAEYQIWESQQIKGLLAFQRAAFEDPRGYFNEILRVEEINQVLGREFSVKQISHTFNLPGALRAMHAEDKDKAIAPLSGAGLLAWTDLRDGDSFASTVTYRFDYESSSEDKLKPRVMFLLPNGVANGVVFTQSGFYAYAISSVFKQSEYDNKKAFRFDDPDANIPWPDIELIVSSKDQNHPYLRDLYPEKF